MRLATKFAGIALLLTGAAMMMSAQQPSVPEIDPTMGLNAVALMGGVLLILRSRKR
jgi:hypothetical protein